MIRCLALPLLPTGLAAAEPGGQVSHLAEIFGISMWPLWIAAVVLIVFIIGRIRALRMTAVLESGLADAVAAPLRGLDLDAAESAAAQGGSIQAQAFAKGFRDFRLGGVTLPEALTHAAANAFRPLYKHIQGISTIASIAPLLGLLGTIIGMIMVFNDLSRSASPDKSQLAEGIMVALFTTAAGLIVAIPGIVCGRWLQARIAHFAKQVEDDIDEACFAFHSALRESAVAGDDFTISALDGLDLRTPAEPDPRPVAAARPPRPRPSATPA